MYVVVSNHVFPLQANLLYSHIVDAKSMEENMNKLNWPTAFVIVAIIFAGAFVYNKPIGAALGASDGMIVKAGWQNAVWQLNAGKVRLCQTAPEKYSNNAVGTIICSPYTDN